MQEKELNGIMAAIILAEMMADRDNKNRRDQKILDAVRTTRALQSALAASDPLTDKLREYYAAHPKPGHRSKGTIAVMQDCFDIDLSDFPMPTLGFDEKRKKREAGTLSYTAWRAAVFNRDNYICQDCGATLPPDKLEAHHLKPYSVAPELEHVVSNGQTLCHKCHVKTDSYGVRNE